jgi:protein MAK11
LQTEYAFSATQGSINAIAGNNYLLALGGFSEIIKLYDLRTKKERGELMEHSGSITYLEFYGTTYLISGSEDGLVIIWRVKDWVPLHKLRVKNVSKVLSFSLHKSGRMLIVLYDNNMFRLWNLLDGRCLFKRKLGVDPETAKVTHKAIGVKWEPTEGKRYAILYEKQLEVFNAEASEPLSSVSSDIVFNCFEFVSTTEIVTADIQGKMTFVKNIQDE